MKHIKTYKIFESDSHRSNGVLNDVEDICSELVDVWYEHYHTKLYNSTRKFKSISSYADVEYTLTISKIRDSDDQYNRAVNDDDESGIYYLDFDYKDVSEVVERLKDYLGYKLIDISIFTDQKSDGFGGDWVNIEEVVGLQDMITDGLKIRFNL